MIDLTCDFFLSYNGWMSPSPTGHRHPVTAYCYNPLNCRQIWSMMTSLLHIVCRLFFSQRHKSTQILKRCCRWHDQMYISHARDAERSLRRQFNVWSTTKNNKSQRLTATRRMCKDSQPCDITASTQSLDSVILLLTQHRLVGPKAQCGNVVRENKISGAFVFICTSSQHKIE